MPNNASTDNTSEVILRYKRINVAEFEVVINKENIKFLGEIKDQISREREREELTAFVIQIDKNQDALTYYLLD